MKKRQNKASGAEYAMRMKKAVIAGLLAVFIFSGKDLNANRNNREDKKSKTVQKSAEKPVKDIHEPYEIKPTFLFFS